MYMRPSMYFPHYPPLYLSSRVPAASLEYTGISTVSKLVRDSSHTPTRVSQSCYVMIVRAATTACAAAAEMRFEVAGLLEVRAGTYTPPLDQSSSSQVSTTLK